MKKAATRTTIIIVLMVLAAVGYYAYLSGKSRESKAETSMTYIETTLSRDLSKDYPPTPKEVVKYYNEILRCLYNEDATDEEIEALGLKARELYDDDLLAINELGTYHMRLYADVQMWRESERRYVGFNLASSTNVEIYEVDGYTFAKIQCGYNVMQKGQNYPSNLMYLLRKDANKRWKIYGWKDVSELGQTMESMPQTE